EIAVSDTALAVSNDVKARWWVATASPQGTDESMANADLRGSPLLALSQRAVAAPASISAPSKALEVTATAIGDDITVNDFGISSEGALTDVPQDKPVPARTSYTFTATVDPAGVMPGASINATIGDPTHPQTDNNALVTLWGTGFTTYSQAAPPYIVIDGAFGDWVPESHEADDSQGDAPADVDLRKVKTSENLDSAVGFYASVAGKAMAGGLPVGSPARPTGGGGGGGGPTVLPRKGAEDFLLVYVDADADPGTGLDIGGIGADYLVEVFGFDGRIRQGSLSRWVVDYWDSFSNPFDGQARGGEIEIGVWSSDLPTTANWTAHFEMTSWDERSDIAPIVGLRDLFSAIAPAAAPSFAWETSTVWQGGLDQSTEMKATANADVDLDGQIEVVTGGEFMEEATPPPRLHPGMAYDSRRNVVWVHGGEAYASVRSDTWKFDPLTRAWTQVKTTGAFARTNGQMVYLPGPDRLAYFGGCSSNGCSSNLKNDTFLFDPTTLAWTQLPAGNAPRPRYQFDFVLDPGFGEGLLFGGCAGLCNSANTLNDTWTFDGNGWVNRSLTMLPPVAPGKRGYLRMAYAEVSATTILYGGYSGGSYLGDTWSYDRSLNRWTKLTPGGAVPTTTAGHTMSYDAASGRVLANGGYFPLGTWEFDPVANGGQGVWSNRLPLSNPID
ncbi:MAG TPA: kelch repeat-containing protein, partial [Thermoplasmata archaeon]|nr:kelch repeat-containing protein [Thermoplasmata archaeon]